jgi:hypothetical protein
MRSSLKSVGIVLGSIIAVVVSVPTARADSIRSMRFFEDLEKQKKSRLTLWDFGQLKHLGFLRDDHRDNGRHLGFSRGNRGRHLGFSFQHRGLEQDSISLEPALPPLFVSGGSSVTPNPEPTTLLLLGSGLTAVAFKFRRRRKS